MKEPFSFWIMALAFILSGCTSPVPIGDQGGSAGSEAGAGSGGVAKGKTRATAMEAAEGASMDPIPAGNVSLYMDRQETELHRHFAFAASPAIRRDRDNVLVTFKSDLLFDPDSFVLRVEALEEIARLANVLEKYPQTRVRVNGFTDSMGSERHNLAISQKRALAVKHALVEGGVHSERILARGFGESKPIRSNATESGRQQNRRVTVVLLPDRS